MKPEHGHTVARRPAKLPELGHFCVGEVFTDQREEKNPKGGGETVNSVKRLMALVLGFGPIYILSFLDKRAHIYPTNQFLTNVCSNLIWNLPQKNSNRFWLLNIRRKQIKVSRKNEPNKLKLILNI